MTDAEPGQRLGGLAGRVVADFALVDGVPRLPEEKLLAWATRFGDDSAADNDLTPALRTEAAEQLVAFALKLVREIGATSESAVGQLLALAGVLLLDVKRATGLFAAAGVPLASAAVERATGFVTSHVPVGAQGRVDGAVSPLATRLPKK